MSETLLEAGAVLAGEATGPGLDTVTARAYEHPVLDGRTVVTLVGATVGPAEDISMEFLGFTPAAEPVPVGHARRQALGFPAWALVHDPAHGRHALALVKDMERLARVARSKPGNAKEGYDGLAQRLGAAAPQFLPTFWEQAGRAFVAAENARMAGTCFTEARRAEQVHGLVIDEDRVRDVHLEFAFAGALTAAMLAEYSRGVIGRRESGEAYELVRSLALRRVAGGLPPHASMAADLARLAKAAGLDADQQADEMVTQLLTYPAMVRSHPSVWKAYRKSLVRVAKRDAAVRVRLLEIFPEPPGWDTDITDQWLELLEASGAAGELTAAGGAWAGEPARWLERFLASRRSGYGSGRRDARLLGLVERMIPRLRGAGELRLAPNYHRVELDVLDLCLAGGVEVAVPPGCFRGGLDLDEWVQDQGEGRRDLSAVAADPRLRPLLKLGVRAAIHRFREGHALTSPALPVRTLEQVLSAAGVREVLAEIVREQTSRAAASTVAGLDVTLTELAALWSPAGMALVPDGFRELLGVDMAAVVGRTLRAGLPVEFVWPEYEAAATTKKNVRIGESWPEIVVYDDQSAHVITPAGEVTEHVFRIPPAGDRHARRYYSHTSCFAVDGDLLVSWSGEQSPAAYWASRPDDRHEHDWMPHRPGWGIPAHPLPLAGGGLTTGVRPVHAGDVRGPGEIYPLATDGQAFWRCEPGESTWQWREFDPRTGELGRYSVPAFLAGLAPGEELVAERCQLRPAAPEFAASPLGVRDGQIGWRSTVAAGVRIGVGLDGRRVTLPEDTLYRVGRTDNERLTGGVIMPGSSEVLPVTQIDGQPPARIRVWTADGEHLLAEQTEGSSTLPPVAWWHALRTRDEAGSAALRKLDDETAARLLAVGAEVTGTIPVRRAVTANLETHLPAVTDGELRARLAEVIARAVRMQRRLAGIPEHLDIRFEAVPALPAVTDDALEQAWDGLDAGHRVYYGGGPGRHQILEQVRLVGALLGGDAGRGEIPAVDATWTALLAGLGGVALRAAAACTPPEDREALTAFLGELIGTPLAGDGTPVRVVRLTQPRMSESKVEVRRDGDRITVLFPLQQNYDGGKKYWERHAIQLSPDGVFTLPEGTHLSEEGRPGGRLAGDRLRTFLTLLAERGPAPWRPGAAEALATATGMTRAEAVLLLAGLPGLTSWETTFLTTEQRTGLGLTAAHAKVARAALRNLTRSQRLALLDAAMPADPADLWQHGPDVAAVAERWVALRGRQIAVPEDLVADLARVVDTALAGTVLQAIAGPRAGDWLSTDGRSDAEGYYEVTTTADEGTPFEGQHLQAVAVALPWLAYRLRWDDPLRAALPEALRLVRARLANPALIVGHGYYPDGRQPDAGPALIVSSHTSGFTSCHIAPARLSGPDDPALGFVDEETATALRVVLSDWIEPLLSTPEGASGDPRDPRVSAPQVVAEASERYGVDADTAAYYLQVLALPDPTDKAVQGYNGWKPAAVRQAQKQLVAAGLLVEAKRERAGRPVFLPGGWQTARAPRLPVESWKNQFYVAVGKPQVVAHPLPELFAAAWARITAGDVPRYRDLEEKP
ncbi:hypothetical protein Aab01nite_31160 [Paractinoplanes abujensis]|uniref:DNA-binding protein n=1 Tax=Paractinoplanes abujensis TaxID=882441 RepID=A0A7W7G8I9_9ACTN|nr:hypothetical protein [Actinoplanes abujensis]MBB4697991.1 hypothetical protein [Actinoplanes abujensis]GID19526.1 hypothetical protein Aab01nite_31160 [Actinoplanes abujensis]